MSNEPEWGLYIVEAWFAKAQSLAVRGPRLRAAKRLKKREKKSAREREIKKWQSKKQKKERRRDEKLTTAFMWQIVFVCFVMVVDRELERQQRGTQTESE